MKPARPALTRAALLNQDIHRSRSRVRARMDAMREAGFNTVLVPLMMDGELHVRHTGRGRERRLAGPLITRLAHARETGGLSTWITIDPLSAGPRGTPELSGFAREHREWLIRNTQGRLMPLGLNRSTPLFSWMNMEYRRTLGDLLVEVADREPAGGVVIDLRAWPGESNDASMWYCCSFDSQRRAEESLGLNFEYLLSEGSQTEIESWKNWVTEELRSFVETLRGRVRVARHDISWKLLVPCSNEESDGRQAPWLDWFADGLADELIIDASHKNGARWLRLADALESATEGPPLIMPAWTDENQLSEREAELDVLPCPGFLLLAPLADGTPVGQPLPDAWERPGAMEDQPRAAMDALAKYIHSRVEPHSAESRYLRMLIRWLETNWTLEADLTGIHERARRMDRRLREGRVRFPQDEHEDLVRAGALMCRLASVLEPPPVAY